MFCISVYRLGARLDSFSSFVNILQTAFDAATISMPLKPRLTHTPNRTHEILLRTRKTYTLTYIYRYFLDFETVYCREREGEITATTNHYLIVFVCTGLALENFGYNFPFSFKFRLKFFFITYFLVFIVVAIVGALCINSVFHAYAWSC